MKMHYNYIVLKVKYVKPTSFEEAMESKELCIAIKEEIDAFENFVGFSFSLCGSGAWE